VMKFARAFMVTSAIAEGGELLATLPSAEALEEEQFEQEFVCFFQHPQGDEELLANLASVSEVDKFTLVPLAEFNPAPPKPAAAAPVKVADAPPAPTEQGSRSGSQTVRVDVSRLDALMNLIGELVIDRTRIAQIGSELAAKYDDANVDDLNETVGHIARISFDLQDQIMKARMLPIETVFNRFPRVIRDLANKLGKDVAFEMEGGDTELDRSVIEVIGDPLLHILRNSVDHGLEMPEDRLAAGKPVQGHVKVQARHEENHIVIEITDDGRGIDADKLRRKAVEKGLVSAEQAEKLSDRDALNFIFASGFSTAAEVSEVSGRGVGMDIVRSNIQKLGGLIDLDTELGQGTRFSLRLPLTLAIIRGLLVNVGAQVFVLPLGSVVETLLIQEDAIQSINRNEVIVLRGQTLPMVRMDEVFGMPAKPGADAEGQYVVVVGLAEKRMALAVDGLVGEKEVVIKSLSRFCGDVSGISGATILGDGNVALIIDVNGIVLQQSA
jgi:two-component system, chemotaxis family, sensor kinase CheA